jgi:hypothetical protein
MDMQTSTTTGRGMNGGTEQGDRLQQAAGGLAEQAVRTAEAQASTTMTRAGETLSQFAGSIRDAGSGMRESQPDIAGFVDTAAERVEEAAVYLREHDARDVLDRLQVEARRQPALVIGGGLVLGLLAGRFLRSGAPAGSGIGRTYQVRSAYTPVDTSSYGSTALATEMAPPTSTPRRARSLDTAPGETSDFVSSSRNETEV